MKISLTAFSLAIFAGLCSLASGGEGEGGSATVYVGGAFVKNGRVELPSGNLTIAELLKRSGGLTLMGNPDFFVLQRGGENIRISGHKGDLALHEGDFVFAVERMIPTAR